MMSLRKLRKACWNCITLSHIGYRLSHHKIAAAIKHDMLQAATVQTNRHCPQCATNRALLPTSVKLLLEGEKYMWYAPHSGFSNQVGELRNALRIAGLLNRTLIIPPITDHHALSLGSCPKYRVVDPPVLRLEALSHISQLISESRYFSIADIVNISAVSPSIVRTIDFRIFSLLWCGAGVLVHCAISWWVAFRHGDHQKAVPTSFPNFSQSLDAVCMESVIAVQQLCGHIGIINCSQGSTSFWKVTAFQ